MTFQQARELPYLDACIKEAGRIHPPFGLPLERVVPPEGAIICGERLSGGTVVGISGWTVHRDPETFGEDVDEWRPERWLVGEEKRRKMEHALLTVSLSYVLSQASSTLFHPTHRFSLFKFFRLPPLGRALPPMRSSISLADRLSSSALVSASALAKTSPIWKYTSSSHLYCGRTR